MLVLSFLEGEWLLVGSALVCVTKCTKSRAKLGIVAGNEVPVLRLEPLFTGLSKELANGQISPEERDALRALWDVLQSSPIDPEALAAALQHEAIQEFLCGEERKEE